MGVGLGEGRVVLVLGGLVKDGLRPLGDGLM